MFECCIMLAYMTFFVREEAYHCFDAENGSKKYSQVIRCFVKKPLKYYIDS